MRKCPLLFLAMALTMPVDAQVYDVLDRVRTDRDLASGCERPYRFEELRLTKAPKGYKPFYISHYGRHGSRYSFTSSTYSVLRDVLNEANNKGLLTETGRKFRTDFLGFYEIPLINTGDLTPLGIEQHARIAEGISKSFPEVFSRGGNVHAISSTSPRAIVSMASFCRSLQKSNPKLDVTGDSFHTNMVFINAAGAPKSIAKHYRDEYRPEPGGEGLGAFAARKMNPDVFLGKFFKDCSFIGGQKEKFDVIKYIFFLWGGYRGYTEGLMFEYLLTPEEASVIWEINNYDMYLEHVTPLADQKSLLGNVITLADDAVAGKGNVMDARFGHDIVLNAFYCLLNIDGCGHVPENADEVKYWFQGFHTPKASTVLFVFYRSRRSPDILFKVIRNGKEVSLPQLVPVDGPYYRYSDFKNWAATL